MLDALWIPRESRFAIFLAKTDPGNYSHSLDARDVQEVLAAAEIPWRAATVRTASSKVSLLQSGPAQQSPAPMDCEVVRSTAFDGNFANLFSILSCGMQPTAAEQHRSDGLFHLTLGPNVTGDLWAERAQAPILGRF